MNQRPFKPVRARPGGGYNLSIGEVRRMGGAIEQAQRVVTLGTHGGDGLHQTATGIQHVNQRLEPLWAVITDTDLGGGYAWNAIADANGIGALVDNFEGPSGTLTANTAFEINGRNDVPIGSRVRMWPSDNQVVWLFEFQQLGGGDEIIIINIINNNWYIFNSIFVFDNTYVTFTSTTIVTFNAPTAFNACIQLAIGTQNFGSADQNSLAISEFPWQQWTSSADVEVTGMVAPDHACLILITNVGTSTITLKHQAGAEPAANRFTNPGHVDYLLGPDGNALTIYDPNAQTWRPIIDVLAASAAAGRLTNVRVYTSNDTWAKPAGLAFVLAWVIGAGGGGGGVTGGAAGSIGASGGGGAGGFAFAKIDEGGLGATEAVAVGTGGAAGTGAGPTNGGTGGDSSFATLTGNGGIGAPTVTASTTSDITAQGSGGGSSGGTINVSGQAGTKGMSFNESSDYAVGGDGGNSMFGTGGKGTAISPFLGTGGGEVAHGYGSGGEGATGTTVDQDGGEGKGGIVILFEFS